MNIVHELEKRNLIHPPSWLSQNIIYLASVGSVAYGVSDGTSDFDVYGIVIEPKEMIFPHLAGEIPGFGKQKKNFEQWQEHHVHDNTALGGKGRDYDFAVYSIVRYFQLCLEGNPNMIDSLFVARRCVLYTSAIGERVRTNRHLFLSKGAYHKFTGYAYSQLHKMTPSTDVDGNIILPKGKRAESVKKYGFDVKYSYHLVRLCLECQQILEEHTLDLERNRELLKSIRRGEWTLGRVKGWFEQKEKQLEELYHTSTLQYSPDQNAIKQLLLECLEHHYGHLGSDAIARPDKLQQALRDIREIANSALSEQTGILTSGQIRDILGA